MESSLIMMGGNHVWIRTDWYLSGYLLNSLAHKESVGKNLRFRTADGLPRVIRDKKTAIRNDDFHGQANLTNPKSHLRNSQAQIETGGTQRRTTNVR